MKDVEKILSIFEVDFRKNHAGRSYTDDYARKAIIAYLAGGGRYLLVEHCFYLFKDCGMGVCEFHSFNAGTGKDLTQGIETLMSTLRSEFTSAVTYYDNPRINELAKFVAVPATVDKINQGVDKTYRMTFDLRS